MNRSRFTVALSRRRWFAVVLRLQRVNREKEEQVRLVRYENLTVIGRRNHHHRRLNHYELRIRPKPDSSTSLPANKLSCTYENYLYRERAKESSLITKRGSGDALLLWFPLIVIDIG